MRLMTADTALKKDNSTELDTSLQAQYQHLAELQEQSAATEQENVELKQRLSRTAKHFRRCRDKLVVLQQIADKAEAVQSRCDDLVSMVDQLSDQANAADERSMQCDRWLSIATRGIEALAAHNPHWQKSSQSSSSSSRQISHSEIHSSKLIEANTRI